MNIEHMTSGSVVIAVVKNDRIDAAAAPSFRLAIQPLIFGARHVILDLSRVTFIDSTGLGAIVGLLKLPGGPRTVAISGATGQVEVLFRLTRMNKVFPMFGTSEAALAVAA